MKKPALKLTLQIIMLMAAFYILGGKAYGQTIYVDAVASGANNGSSWANAYNHLQDALAAASSGEQIWVAAGTYYPDEGGGQANNDRTATFQLLDGVEIYGGFAGTESSGFNPDERDFEANAATLNGDIDGDGEFAGNAHHVVTGTETDATAVLDGFTITGGNADGSNPNNSGGGLLNDDASHTLRNLTISGNRASFSGGGMFNIDGSPTLINVIFSGNYAKEGGGMYNSGGATFLNVSFYDNQAAGGGFLPLGGGLYHDWGNSIMTNVTVVRNQTSGLGGGIYVNSGRLTINNSIIWGNGGTSSHPDDINTSGNPVELNYTIYRAGAIEGNYTADENSVTGTNPEFVDDENGDLHLQETSPAINAGSNQLYTDAGGDLQNDTDLDDQSRLDSGTIDMGAYEFQGEPVVEITPDGNNILYVDIDVSGGNGSGSSWANAVPELRDALGWASGNWDAGTDGTLQIWVAGGQYLPTGDDTDRTATFQLLDGVEIYGGFTGTESSGFNPDDRDFEANTTTLNGDIDGDGEFTGNAYHVVTGTGIDATAVLDGFTITGGHANGSGSLIPSGGGLYNFNASPTLRNLTISGNWARNGSGMLSEGDPVLTNVGFFDNHSTRSSDRGGGLYSVGNPTLINVIFSGNYAERAGGGMYNSGNATFLNVSFYDNQAGEGFSLGEGGGLYHNSGNSTMTNVTVVRNQVSASGLSGGIHVNSGRLTINNSIIWGNVSTDDGTFPDPADIDNRSGNPVELNYTIYRAGAIEGSYTADENSVTGTNPEFVDAANGNLHLQETSPAINAGSNQLYTDAGGDLQNDTDLDDQSRLDSGTIDMGAYEFQGEPDVEITPDGNNILYVDIDVSGGNGSGSSWVNAIPELRDALGWASGNWDAGTDGTLQIWVAGGQYLPTGDDTDRTATFQLLDGVEIYGGFAGGGGEDELSDRNWEANAATLHGDIDNSGTLADNSYHVVTGTETDATAVLDGFTITGGHADGGSENTFGGGLYNLDASPTLRNLTISGNQASVSGGGMWHYGGSPTLTNVAFSGNRAGFGGGIYILSGNPTLINVTFSGNNSVNISGVTDSGSGGGMVNAGNPTLINVTFSGNRADSDGGGMLNAGNPTLTNVTFSGNQAGSDGGGMYNTDTGNPMLSNVIIWGNQAGGSPATASASIFNDSSTPTISFSLIANSGGSGGSWNSNIGTDDGNNLDTDPLFIQPVNPDDTPTTAGDLRLMEGSPVINAGSNQAYTDAGGDLQNDPDLAGEPRVFDVGGGGIIDMGAYEFQGEPDVEITPDGNNILYVDIDVSGGDGTGSSWANAVPELRDALGWASGNWDAGTDGTLQIWVAGGQYLPTGDNTDRTATFRLINGVEIYGGFAGGGGEDELSDRNWEANAATLNGDINNSGTFAGNSYHVVTGTGTDATAVLDGFTITGGNANATGFPNDRGAGMRTGNGSPTLTNLTVSGNRAGEGGGMHNAGNPTLTNVIFSGNQAENGGALLNNGGAPMLTNVTFSGNRATLNGGVVYNQNSGSPTLTNVIIWNNEAGGSTASTSASIYNISGGTCVIAYSLIANSGGSGGWNTVIGADNGNNLDADPQFSEPVNPGDAPTTAGDLPLTETSPAINAGDPGTDPLLFPADENGDPVDLAGNPRVFDVAGGGIIDMGAYEFQGESQADLNLTLTVDEGWRMLASPYDGLTYADMIGGLWTQGFPGSDYPSADFPNVYTWPNDQSGNNPADWVALGNQADPIPAGTGFLIQVYADDDYDGTVEGSEEFDKTIPLSGAVRSGDVSPPMNTTPGGWTLAGNPYTVPVDFSALTTSGLSGAAHVYDGNYSGSTPGPTNGNPGGWRSTDGTYGDLVDGIIAPGQGFFVQNSGSSGSLTFTEASKTTGGGFYGKEKELRDFVRLEVQGEAGVNSAWIRFSEEGSDEQMEGDALELQPYSEQYTLLGARKTDGTLLDIAHYPLPDEETEIPLAMETTLAGTYHITATDLDVPAGTQLYLHDRKTGSVAELAEGMSYSFELDVDQAMENSPLKKGAQGGAKSRTLPEKHPPLSPLHRGESAGSPIKAAATGDNRFLITTSQAGPTDELPEQVALNQNYPNPFNPSTVIRYQLPANSQVRLEVYDMLGRQVATLVEGTVEAGEHVVNFDAGHLTSGVYLYRLSAHGPNGSNKIFTKKLTLIK